MGRRALPKFSTERESEFSRYLKGPDEIPRPWDAAALFGRNAPLELEIGCGKGLFLRNVAAARPEHNFLGIEIGKKYAAFSALGLCKRRLENAIMFCGDATRILAEDIPENSLFAVHVYFPDPWWKRAHKKRRVLREEVLQLIESRLIDGGLLHFWTDVEEYFRTTLKLLAIHTKLEGPFEVSEPEDYHTHFERRTRLHGETVYRSLFRKSVY